MAAGIVRMLPSGLPPPQLYNASTAERGIRQMHATVVFNFKIIKTDLIIEIIMDAEEPLE